MLQWPITRTPTEPSITDDGFRVLGGQRRPVPDGTTDVTRTIAIGNPTAEHKEMFTGLKGTYRACSRSISPWSRRQPIGYSRPAIPLGNGKDYDHGTGHGVGCYLSVHEGPQRIGKTPGPTPALRPGMVVSNEPGYYEPNAYGIRCENLVVVVENDMACCHLSH